MTIAIGFMTGNASILCADSQEVVSDYAKTTTQKIRTTTFFENWRLGITGSGDDTTFMDMFEHDLQMSLGKIREFDYAKIVETIETKLRNFHKVHIWPMPKDERPSFELLIAVQGIKPHGSRALLYTHKTTVVPVHYRSVGIGSYLADYLSSKLDVAGNGIDPLVYNSPTEELERFGVFLVQQIKSAIHGCDGETLVATFRGDGTLKWTLGEEVREIESWFSSFHSNIVPLLRLVSHAETPDEEFKQSMHQFNADMNLLRVRQARDSSTHSKRFDEFLKAQAKVSKKPRPKQS
jgi:hypothetical protein